MNQQPSSDAFKVGNLSAGESRMDLSKQWMARPHDQRFLSLTDLELHVHARAERCQEARIENRAAEIIAPEPETADDTHKLSLGLPSGEQVCPTHWAFGQLSQLAGAPASYLRTLPSQIVADAVNYGLRVNRKTEQVKVFYDPDSLLAATGPDYGRVYDHEVVRAVQNVAGDGTGDQRWKIPGVMDWRTSIYDPRASVTKETTTLYASDRDVFMFLVDDLNPIEVGKLPDGSPDLMFRGFYVCNSEVGSAALKLAAFYLRAICCNRIMWGVEGFEEFTIRHTKYAPDRFVEMARPALESFAEGSTVKITEAVAQAKAAIVAKDQEAAIEYLKERKYSRQKAIEILEAAERQEGHPARSAWDMAQGITTVAQKVPYQDERFAIELTATRILEKVAA